MLIYIAHVKCAQEHSLIGGMIQIEPDRPDKVGAFRLEIMQQFEAMVEERIVVPKCEVCGSSEFHVVMVESGFKTLEEARGLIEHEVLNAARQRLLHQSRN